MFIYSQEVIQASLKPWYESILSFTFWPESLSEFHGAVGIGILKFNGEHQLYSNFNANNTRH